MAIGAERPIRNRTGGGAARPNRENEGSENMRTLLVMLVAIALGGASLAFLPPAQGEPVTVGECAQEFSAGVAGVLPPEARQQQFLAKLNGAAVGICTEVLKIEGIETTTSEAEVLAALGQVLTSQPELYTPLCTAATDVIFAVAAEPLRFVTPAEKQRYRRDHCARAADYLDPSTLQLDFAQLAADHPETYAPMCASLMQHGADPAALASYTPKQLRRITRRSCLEALRDGTISCGPNGVLDAHVDQPRMQEIFARSADEVARS
jgi:hypothetical protein